VARERRILLIVSFLTWLIQGAIGPALVGLPATWSATDLSGAARRWFERIRHTDGLSRIVQAAAGNDADLSNAEFAAVRHLLEEDSTWVEVGRATVETLAKLIASRLTGRSAEDALATGRAIAAGLLEFAVRDLEPEWFGQILFARLDRIACDQASALDQALLSIHADLAAQVHAHDAAESVRSAQVMDQLGRVLDRLPPGPADEVTVKVYLATLIRWLNTDPWAEDTWFGGPALVPAAIERKRRITSSRYPYQELDADDLARRCTRLAVLGEPGTGKTWMAKRTVRLCAEAALDAMAAGARVDEVELPLYITCAQLAAAPAGGGIRRAIITSAIDLLPDLGGTQIVDALRVLFAERNAPTLLVADSLDEAPTADDRIRQADTLSPAWRIVLTTRPGSWNRQLTIRDDGLAGWVGSLQPLQYREDVEPFVTAWFTGRPDQAAGLIAQLRSRPALQRSATVPLILAFYCIIGGSQRLPARRADVYSKVIRRMLTGRWRGVSGRYPEPDSCLEILRGWAWSAAARNRVSGIGAWQDEFPTPQVKLSQDNRDALDHLAAPLGPPDIDTGATRRRFVHRSIHEYLVAEHVALRMDADEAAAELLNHLWFDRDWEYAAPAALAMHPQRHQVLYKLMSSITGGNQFPLDLAPVDGCWEVRRFLARVAVESSEADWPRQAAELIGRARLDLVTSKRDHDPYLMMAIGWPTSNRLILNSLSSLLPDNRNLMYALDLVETVARLDLTADEQGEIREKLLSRLTADVRPTTARSLARTLARLHPTADERTEIREKLLGLLARKTYPLVDGLLADTVASLAVAAGERAQTRKLLFSRFAAEGDLWTAWNLAEAVARLDPTADERTEIREKLLGLLVDNASTGIILFVARTVARLDPTAEERAQLREALWGQLAVEVDRSTVAQLASMVDSLAVTVGERAQARHALLTLVADTNSFSMAMLAAEEVAARLNATAEEQAEIREKLLGRLVGQTDRSLLTRAVAQLDPTAEERARLRNVLLMQLTADADSMTTRNLAEASAQLAVRDRELAEVRQKLLYLLSVSVERSATKQAQELAETVSRLQPTGEDRAWIRNALLTLLATETTSLFTAEPQLGAPDAQTVKYPDPQTVTYLTRAIAQFDPTAEERAQVKRALLALLPWVSLTAPWMIRSLADTVARLAVTAQERTQTRKELLTLLSAEDDPMTATDLAKTVAGLDPTEKEQTGIGKKLLDLLAATTVERATPELAQGLADTVARLDPTAMEQVQLRKALLTLLAGMLDGSPSDWAGSLAYTLARLDPTAKERARTREALFTLLSAEPDPWIAEILAEAIVQLAVTAEDREITREGLLARPASEADPDIAPRLVNVIVQLARTTLDRKGIRDGLIIRRANETHPESAHELETAIIELGATITELDRPSNWLVPPGPALLLAVRRNSELDVWLAALPVL